MRFLNFALTTQQPREVLGTDTQSGMPDTRMFRIKLLLHESQHQYGSLYTLCVCALHKTKPQCFIFNK